MVHLFKRVPMLRSKKCIQLWFGFFSYHFTNKKFPISINCDPFKQNYCLSGYILYFMFYTCIIHMLQSFWHFNVPQIDRQLWIITCIDHTLNMEMVFNLMSKVNNATLNHQMPKKKVTHWTLKLHWGCCSACCCCCSKSRPPSLRAPKLSAAEEDGNYVDEKIMKYFF